MASFQDQQSEIPAGPSPSLDPETSPVPGQQAWGILDLHGKLVRSSEDSSSGSDTDIAPVIRDAKTLYGMLVESTPLVAPGQGLKRMTIDFGSLRYVVARDEHHIYLIQVKV